MPKNRIKKKPGKIKKAATAVSRKIAFSVNLFALFHPSFRKFSRNPQRLKLKNLKPGDLFFFRINFGDIIRAPFNLATGVPFIHVAMYVGKNKIARLRRRGGIELISLGSIRNYPFVFRAEMSQEQQQAVVDNLIAKQDSYSEKINRLTKLQAILRIKVKNPRIEGYSCANVIAESYAKEGIDLVPGVHPLRQGIHYLIKSKKLKLLN